MPALAPTDFLDLTYRAGLDLLVLRWMRQTTPEEMQQGYHLLLTEALTQSCGLWLIDARRRDHANQQGTDWMVKEFFPQVARQMRCKVYMAYLFAPNHLMELEQDMAVPPLTYFDGRPYQVERFTEEQAAIRWLDQCRLQPKQ